MLDSRHTSHDTDTEQTEFISQRPEPPWTSRIVGGALFAWILFLTAVTQGVSWVAQQLSTQGSGGGLSDPDFIATLIQNILILLPLALLASAWKEPGYRLVFRLWVLAALFGLLSSIIHIPGATQAYLSIILQISIAVAFAAVLTRQKRLPSKVECPGTHRLSSLAVVLLISPILVLPWVTIGGLGTPLESLLNLTSAILFGICGALLIRRLTTLTPPDSALDNRFRLLGGLAAGAILVPMSSAFGFGGSQLLLLLTVPTVGWVAIALLGRDRDTLALTLLIGLSAAGPLLFVDPREMALAISFGLFSTLAAAYRAAIASMLLAWIVGAMLLVRRWLGYRSTAGGDASTTAPSLTGALVAVPAWLLLTLAYVFLGNPGFYGDRLFVVMSDQADVSSAQELGDVVERRRFIYETLATHAEVTQRDLRDDLSRWGFAYTPYYLVNGLEVEGGPIMSAWLQNRADVERVLYSPILRPAPPEEIEPVSAPEPMEPPWNITIIGADAVWREFGARGAGIVIGQSDSGVQWDHPEIRDSYRGSDGNHNYNWFDPWNHSQQPVDTGGHGTHTLGTVLGNTTGVAPDASWFGCANLVRNVGSTAYYLDCMQFMLAPFPVGGDPFQDGDAALGANVLNNSWGCPQLEGCDAQSLLPAVLALRYAGTFVVVSAGNEGPACASLNSPPAIYEQVLSVGAVDRAREVTVFSSRGPVTIDGSNRTKPDLVAPGFDIVSAIPENSYRAWQGTSMAGPHVSGVVALLWSANPDLIGDVQRTEQILIETAQPLANNQTNCTGDHLVPNNTYGYGLVDAYSAVERAISLSGN